jgi:hypothetical protein
MPSEEGIFLNHLQVESAELPTERLRAAWNWLDSQRGQMQDTLGRWCGQTSWSNDPVGLCAMADRLRRDFEPLGLAAQSIPLPPLVIRAARGVEIEQATGPGLLWHHRPQAPRRILLVIHYDTVYPPVPRASDGTLGTPVCYAKGERLIGPGVADAKGGIAVIRHAALRGGAVVADAAVRRLGSTRFRTLSGTSSVVAKGSSWPIPKKAEASI